MSMQANVIGDGRVVFSLGRLFKQNPDLAAARALYAETITAARQPGFFTVWGVPDTAEGRFEVLALHAFLVLRRLKTADGQAALSQAYFDVMFDDLDANLRELGVGDISVGKKVKKLAGGFYGRIKAYDQGLDSDGDQLLLDALARFVFRSAPAAPGVLAKAAAFVRAESARLADLPDDAVRADPQRIFGGAMVVR